ncbi:acylneuraminate cytidylyltransferase family protein [Butyrivibrio sp. MB2005]|uniref:acylneuraminate cytidylyltransferase family protein n=1 Tax=Butyrivibrio sp. MB2005 TaxID=1280678 RepID=UPI000415B3F7|nr:acylneuraminate cytidylyltransferase family protein [Butyrivibrio sp. MB2005]
MKNIAIIPARSGSKGLPDKNIRELCGKPLIAYSIEAANKSGLFDEVFVSTDSEKYADIAKNCGASVPFLRSDKNAMDSSSSWDVVEEVLEKFETMGKEFETFCLLQPTSPLRNSDDIIRAYETYKKKDANAVVSVCELEHPLSWCGQLSEDLSMDGFISQDSMNQRQKQAVTYRLNGAIYLVNIKSFREERFLYRKGCYACIMDKRNSVDIDTIFDFKYAEFLLKDA